MNKLHYFLIFSYVLAGCAGGTSVSSTTGNLVLHGAGSMIQVADGAGTITGSSLSVTSDHTPGFYANDTGKRGANVALIAGNADMAPHSLAFVDYRRKVVLATLGDAASEGDLRLASQRAQFVAPAGACTGGHAFSNGVAVYSSSGAPKCVANAGSLYLRDDGTAGNRFYVSEGGGKWAAVPGV